MLPSEAWIYHTLRDNWPGGQPLDFDMARAVGSLYCELERQLPQNFVRVWNERMRQIHKLGWTAEHDNEGHRFGFLSLLAVGKALAAVDQEKAKQFAVGLVADCEGLTIEKVIGGDKRTLLVQAAALIIAELDRMDRVEVVPE